mmetsp:Transcript_159117/g.386459  ORF Transcript_159117/g.386459 Transcript_159117/m.386459 type:complete len:315 (-) Transcript_159117:279-1223(-)
MCEEQGLEVSVRVVNTFIHVEAEEPPAADDILRCRTDPTPRIAPPLQRLVAARSHGPGAADAAATPAMPIQHLSTVAMVDIVAEAPTAEEDDGAVWHLEARRLQNRDTRLSKTFTPTVHCSIPDSEFVMTLIATPVSKRRGQSSFKASQGRGSINLKCCSHAIDADMAVTVRVGMLCYRLARHNFAQTTVCKFPDEVDFVKHVDGESLLLTITLRLSLVGLRLTCSPPLSCAQISDDGEDGLQVATGSSGLHPHVAVGASEASSDTSWCSACRGESFGGSFGWAWQWPSWMEPPSSTGAAHVGLSTAWPGLGKR